MGRGMAWLDTGSPKGMLKAAEFVDYFMIGVFFEHIMNEITAYKSSSASHYYLHFPPSESDIRYFLLRKNLIILNLIMLFRVFIFTITMLPVAASEKLFIIWRILGS